MALLLLMILSALIGGINCTTFKENDRINCYPEDSPTQKSCTERGCKWMKATNPRAPRCFYDPTKNYGYSVGKGSSQVPTPLGYRMTAKRIDGQPTTGIFKGAVREVQVDVEFQTRSRLRVKLRDKANLSGRYEVPVSRYFPRVGSKATSTLYEAMIGEGPFNLKIKRRGTNFTIWDTSIGPLIYSNQFLQISSRLPSKYIYGFGEHEHGSYNHDLNFVTMGMFSRDQPPGPNANLYGVHPFYLCMESDGSAHGVLFLNSNAMDVVLQPAPALTYRTIGGILDFYFFFGPTPEQVVQQYTELIGRPVMPAYWALGFQLCRYGYNHIDTVKRMVERNKKYGIPQDVQYGDIDYMERQLDFTYNKKTYKGLPEYVKQLKKEGIRYISILDPAISANETKGTYPPYTLGSSLGVWIKDANGQDTIYGKVWPDYPNVVVNTSLSWDEQVKRYRAFVAFPDFFHPNIDKWWGKLIVDFYKTLKFDGLWIDMNEPASFVHGSVNGCPNNTYEYPPYKPAILGSTLFSKTLCMSAKHHDGVSEYNYHSLYGWSQTAPTLRALHAATGKRGIVISRSTYPSSGRYAGHWLGDNTSKWGDLAKSIIGMMEFSLFGIPYSGADICGFFQDTTEPLCERWMQLGAFYPFSRNHNGLGNKPQDPAYFGAAFAKNAKAVLNVRYTLLPYLYTLFFDAHVQGNTVVRPLMHEFPDDKMTWTVATQFLWGPALLISPVLTEGAVQVDAYIPNTRWFEYRTGKEILRTRRGKKVTIEAPKNFIPLHVRGGYILPLQEPANNTMYSRRKPMGLLVSLDDEGKAKGKLFWDDGEAIDDIRNNRYQLLGFVANKTGLFITVHKNGYSDALNYHISFIRVFGVREGTKVDVISKTANVAFEKQILKITNVKLGLDTSHRLLWKFKTSSARKLSCHIGLIGFVVLTRLILFVIS